MLKVSHLLGDRLTYRPRLWRREYSPKENSQIQKEAQFHKRINKFLLLQTHQPIVLSATGKGVLAEIRPLSILSLTKEYTAVWVSLKKPISFFHLFARNCCYICVNKSSHQPALNAKISSERKCLSLFFFFMISAILLSFDKSASFLYEERAWHDMIFNWILFNTTAIVDGDDLTLSHRKSGQAEQD